MKLNKHYCPICSTEHDGSHIEWNENDFEELNKFIEQSMPVAPKKNPAR